MCGIVGYIGHGNAMEMIVQGLSRLEYRGYDSAGISIVDGHDLKTIKRQGRLTNLKKALEQTPLSGHLGIGHTRWATHGIPNELNAHPHLNQDLSISIVHNGIIENYQELKDELLEDGICFRSQTDSEVVAHLISKYYDNDLLKATHKAISRIKGAYAFCILSSKEPHRLIAVRHRSPLVMGLWDEGYMIASDIPCIIEHTKNVIYFDDGDILDVNEKDYAFYNMNLEKITKEVNVVEYNMDAASKGGYEHFLIKEIHEQPAAVRDAIERKLKNDCINLEEGYFTKEEIASFNKIFITACGTALHAGMVGKYALEQWLHLPVECEIASEFHYGDYFVDENTLVILVSQSGETADTLAALKKAKEYGATTLAITNVVGSSIAREADKVIYCYAGPEISVASTKAYTTQLICLYFLALDFAEKVKTLSEEEINKIIGELRLLPEKIESILNAKTDYKAIAESIKDASSIFYTGRLLDYVTAKEGALKLKEISYIHTEALAAGELKHGSMALIEEGMPVFSIATQSHILEKTSSNNEELAARGAIVTAITFEGVKDMEKGCKEVIHIPKTLEILSPLLAVIPTQLIAYHTSYAKGNDVDKPRNLAKAVTVE
ncbi:MAG: glutamine--fructose-6-phosphate transaminase (isomerizing) [Tissierellia bacterium]|nr:glutamine--fructose-6-phosphate transaminase (isomerizing) [Tissierellia bacterium]